MRLKFQEILQLCPSHGMTSRALLECFYRGHGPKNRSLDDQRSKIYVLRRPYEVLAKGLDGMVECTSYHAGYLANLVTKFEVHTMEKEKHFPLQACIQKKRHTGM